LIRGNSKKLSTKGIAKKKYIHMQLGKVKTYCALGSGCGGGYCGISLLYSYCMATVHDRSIQKLLAGGHGMDPLLLALVYFSIKGVSVKRRVKKTSSGGNTHDRKKQMNGIRGLALSAAVGKDSYFGPAVKKSKMRRRGKKKKTSGGIKRRRSTFTPQNRQLSRLFHAAQPSQRNGLGGDLSDSMRKKRKRVVRLLLIVGSFLPQCFVLGLYQFTPVAQKLRWASQPIPFFLAFIHIVLFVEEGEQLSWPSFLNFWGVWLFNLCLLIGEVTGRS